MYKILQFFIKLLCISSNLITIFIINRFFHIKDIKVFIFSRYSIVIFIIFVIIPFILKFTYFDNLDNAHSYKKSDFSYIEDANMSIINNIIFSIFAFNMHDIGVLRNSLIVFGIFSLTINNYIPFMLIFFYKFYYVQIKARKFLVISSCKNLSIDNHLSKGFYRISNFLLFFNEKKINS